MEFLSNHLSKENNKDIIMNSTDFYLEPKCEVVELRTEQILTSSPQFNGMGEEESW